MTDTSAGPPNRVPSTIRSNWLPEMVMPADRRRHPPSSRPTRPTQQIDASRFRNPDDDPRGPWLASDMTGPGERFSLNYEWAGHFPPTGRRWAFSQDRMARLDEEGRIHYRPNGRPTLKRYFSEIVVVDKGEAAGSGIAFIIRLSMQKLARQLALCPWELHDLEWRDLERVLYEVFESLGFATTLTRSAKDGGFDLQLSNSDLSYLVEVKHWSPANLVGEGVISHFAEVVVTEQADRGLLLSSSGFTRRVLSGRIEVEQHIIALGDGSKIISLCKEYVKAEAGIWMPSTGLSETLLVDTF